VSRSRALRFGIVGTSRQVAALAEALERSPSVSVPVAVIPEDEALSVENILSVPTVGSALERFGERLDALCWLSCGTAILPDAQAALDRRLHLLLAILPDAQAALDRRLHLLLAMPQLSDAPDLVTLVEACADRGVTCVLGGLERSLARYRVMHRAVAAGEIGRPVCLRHMGYVRGGPDRLEAAAAEALDLACWLFNPAVPVAVHALTSPTSDLADARHLAITVRFTGGGVALLTLGRLPARTPRVYSTMLVGSEGVLSVDTRTAGQIAVTADGLLLIDAEEPDPRVPWMIAAAEALVGEAVCSPTRDEARTVLGAAEAAMTSLGTGHAVAPGRTL
jgi:hypothetical protein